MIDSQPVADEVQKEVDRLLGLLQGDGEVVDRHERSELNDAWLVAMAVAHRSSHSCLKSNPDARHPSRMVRVCSLCRWPVRTDASEGEVACRQLGATRVDVVEDLDHLIDGHLLAGDFLLMEFDLGGCRRNPAELVW